MSDRAVKSKGIFFMQLTCRKRLNFTGEKRETQELHLKIKKEKKFTIEGS